MICWYCYWGWPKQVADIYDAALKELGYDIPLEYGLAHIVWSDENFEEEHIRWCLSLYDPVEFARIYPDTTFEDMYCRDRGQLPEQLAIVKRSLERLLEVPKEIRECVPEDYDEENPENFPPPLDMEMVKYWWMPQWNKFEKR
jgi:hypothetical protein